MYNGNDAFREGGGRMSQSAPWKVIHMTRSEAHANRILEVLKSEGFMARTHQVYRAVSSEENYYEIIVLASEAREAQQILIERSLLL